MTKRPRSHSATHVPGARAMAAALALAALLPVVTGTTGCFTDRRQIVDTQRTEAFDLFTAGQELERRGEVARAIEYYARAAEQSPRPAFFAAAGAAHAKLGQHDQAVHYYDLALQLNPEYEGARAQRELSALALERQTETPVAEATRLEVADVLTDPAATAPEAVVEEPAIAEPAPTEEPDVQPTPTPAPEVAAPAAPEVPVTPEAPTAPPAPAAPAIAATEPEVAQAPPAAPAEVAEAPIAVQEQAPAQVPVADPFAISADPFALDLPGLMPDIPTIAPADLPPIRVRASGEGINREQVRAQLFSHVTLEEVDPAVEREAAVSATEAQRWDEASRRWENVASRAPQDLEARLRWADALQRSGRNVRAWEVFKQAQELEPTNATIFREWGNSLVRAGQLERAAEQYREAVRLDSSLVEVRNNLAAIDIDLGRASQAVVDLESLVAAEPDFAPAWLNLAIALESAGADKASQIRALEQYLALDGTRDAEAEAWLVTLRSSR